MEVTPKDIKNYQTDEGQEPFKEWFSHLKDNKAKVAITKRLERVELGNLGFCNKVGEGVLELKVDIGPGYRVYLGQDGRVLVILLCGGDKHRQNENIALAKEYWADYKLRKQEGEKRHGS